MSDFIHFAVSMVIICRKQDMPWRGIWVFHACLFIFYLVGLDCIVLPIAFGDALASAHLCLDCYSKKDIIKEQFMDYHTHSYKCWHPDRRTDGQSDGRTDGRPGWQQYPPSAKRRAIKKVIIKSMKYSYPPPWHILLSTYYYHGNGKMNKIRHL